MVNKNYPKWIDGYAKTVYELVRDHDPGAHLPFNGFNFYPLFDKLWIDKIYQAITKFNKLNIPTKEIISFLPTHSSLKFNLLEIIVDLKTSDMDFEKARFMIDFFIKAIQERAINKNLWWENNLIREYKNIIKIAEDKKFVKANRDLSLEVAKIVVGCVSLVHGLYNDFCMDFGYDVFGPYNALEKYGANSSLFVRQLFDLKPIELWPEFNNFPYKKIKIYTIYKNVEIDSHYLGSHLVYKQNLVDNLSHFQMEIEGKLFSSLDELKKIREIIFERAGRHYTEYKNLGFEKQKSIWLWQLCYQFKEFFNRLGLDWKPSEEIISAVKNKELVDNISNYNTSYKVFREKFGINYLKNIYSS
jgi:hypothetical protein